MREAVKQICNMSDFEDIFIQVWNREYNTIRVYVDETNDVLLFEFFCNWAVTYIP